MYQSGRAGEQETRQKSVSLPPKVGELASLNKAGVMVWLLGVAFKWG